MHKHVSDSLESQSWSMLLPHVETQRARVGVFGIGLAAYWPQFPGLKERLENYQREIEAKIRKQGYAVVSAGLVDTTPLAQAAGSHFRQEQVDIILCYVGTYATSSQVVPVVQFAHKPVLDGKSSLLARRVPPIRCHSWSVR